MGAKYLNSEPCGCKICKKGTFERLFLTKFEFSGFWGFFFIKKCQKPTLMGAFRACKTPSLWMQFFEKQGHSRGTSTETRSTEEPQGEHHSFIHSFIKLALKLIC